MVIVTNRIKVKTGMGAKMAPRFTSGNRLEQFDGFKKVEVWLRTNKEEYDELNVNMYWDSMEAFEGWRNSDEFKQAHKRPEPGEQTGESPMLGSEIVISDIVAVKEK